MLINKSIDNMQALDDNCLKIIQKYKNNVSEFLLQNNLSYSENSKDTILESNMRISNFS